MSSGASCDGKGTIATLPLPPSCTSRRPSVARRALLNNGATVPLRMSHASRVAAVLPDSDLHISWSGWPSPGAGSTAASATPTRLTDSNEIPTGRLDIQSAPLDSLFVAIANVPSLPGALEDIRAPPHSREDLTYRRGRNMPAAEAVGAAAEALHKRLEEHWERVSRDRALEAAHGDCAAAVGTRAAPHPPGRGPRRARSGDLVPPITRVDLRRRRGGARRFRASLFRPRLSTTRAKEAGASEAAPVPVMLKGPLLRSYWVLACTSSLILALPRSARSANTDASGFASFNESPFVARLIVSRTSPTSQAVHVDYVEQPRWTSPH